jgi:hypothetical protein
VGKEDVVDISLPSTMSRILPTRKLSGVNLYPSLTRLDSWRRPISPGSQPVLEVFCLDPEAEPSGSPLKV